MGVRKSGKKYRVAEKRDGIYLDIFVYPEMDLKKVGDDHFYMNGAKVLYEQGKFGKFGSIKCLIVLLKAISRATTAVHGSMKHYFASIKISA